MTTHTVDVTPNFKHLVEMFSGELNCYAEYTTDAMKRRKYKYALKKMYMVLHQAHMAILSATDVEDVVKIRDRMGEAINKIYEEVSKMR